MLTILLSVKNIGMLSQTLVCQTEPTTFYFLVAHSMIIQMNLYCNIAKNSTIVIYENSD